MTRSRILRQLQKRLRGGSSPRRRAKSDSDAGLCSFIERTPKRGRSAPCGLVSSTFPQQCGDCAALGTRLDEDLVSERLATGSLQGEFRALFVLLDKSF